jgi:hypothetical protein
MTIAELFGKISRAGENLTEQLEDLLTSDVFSVCRYVRPETLLLPFLYQAKGLDDAPLENYVKGSISRVNYLFWPRLQRSEPDVLVSLKLSSGQFFLILIEAKYFSPKSSSPLSEVQLELAETPRDQLAREYFDLFDAHKALKIPESKVLGRVLVYVTAHRSIPTDSLEESVDEIRHFMPGKDKINLFWTSWFELHPIISKVIKCQDWERPILKDLQLLLERKHLIRFKEFTLDKASRIYLGSIHAIVSKKSIMRYKFDLATADPLARPVFYSSRSETGTYQWTISAKPLSRRIYKGGAQ